MTKKKESLAQLALLQNEKPPITELDLKMEEDDGAIEASKEVHHSGNDKEPVVEVKTKKPRPPKTQKQLEAFAITRQKGLESNTLRKQATEEKLKAKKEEKEERIIKTAIIIKKKQIKRERILDNVSDGENDEPAKIPRQKKTTPSHQFVFV